MDHAISSLTIGIPLPSCWQIEIFEGWEHAGQTENVLHPKI